VASGTKSSVSGGSTNKASGHSSSVIGGQVNIAIATHSSVLGGTFQENVMPDGIGIDQLQFYPTLIPIV